MRDDNPSLSTGDPILPEADGGRRYSAPALEKGLDILEALSASREAMTLSEIAEALGRSKGEIFRMVAVLEARGYIERGDDDRFRMAGRLFRLGLERPGTRDLLDVAAPVMTAFADATGYSAHLAVVSGTQMVVVRRAESGSQIGLSVRVGYRDPLVITGSGHCLLAFMDPRRRHRLLAQIGEEDPRLDIGALVADLERWRALGGVLRPSGTMEGSQDISAPIIDPREGGAVAALTAPYIRLKLRPIEAGALLTRLIEAAGRISAALA
ncbi:IclR family transcriptional regulator [Chthonobacter albigriseus]|uniref:IclR family transcriptional regulator n=1 Tax=Chthonobacter albigriseus TaxID=1683161 RepID=UPI0015EEA4B5|nr:IclR family transcriptional regulator [Chthonobacter albigriseus]